MALYIPDYRLQEALKIIEKMEGPEGELVRYAMEQKTDYIDKLVKKNREMREVFIKINDLGTSY